MVEIDDKYILENFFISNGKINGHRLKHMTDEELKYLNNRYNDSFSMNETLSRIKHGIEEHPKCPICGDYAKYYKNGKFHMTCGNPECYNKLNGMNVVKTCLEKYGVTSYGKTDECKAKISEKNKQHSAKSLEKRKKTCLEKFGVDNCYKAEECKQKIKNTCLERYGVDVVSKSEEVKAKIRETVRTIYNTESVLQAPEVKEKIKNTCLERYGVDNPAKSPIIHKRIAKTSNERFGTDWPSQSEQVKEKVKQTCLDKYGVTCSFLVPAVKDKAKDTNNAKYGVDWYMQTDEFRNKMSEKMKDPDYQDEFFTKAKYTCLKKYGCQYYSQTEQSKKHMSEVMSSEEVQNKMNETKRKNGTFKTSKPEDTIYKLLIERYPDTIRQHKSKEYQFKCDFYIPSLDLYIEYQGSQYHNNRPYTGTDTDIEEKNMLIEKANNSTRHKAGKKSQYDMIVYTWTELDVKKRNTAKANKLNYIEFWSVNEVKEWLKFC